MIGIQGETALEEVTKSPADAALSTTSTNSVQNKVITKKINEINNDLNKGSFSKAYGGYTTYGSMLAEFATHIDFSKVNKDTVIQIGINFYHINRYDSSSLVASCATLDTTGGNEIIQALVSASTPVYAYAIGGSAFINGTDTVLPGEVTVTIYY